MSSFETAAFEKDRIVFSDSASKFCTVGFRLMTLSLQWLNQMLMLSGLPGGSSQSRLAAGLDILALIGQRLILLGILLSGFRGNRFPRTYIYI